jgi:hypothetical protein
MIPAEDGSNMRVIRLCKFLALIALVIAAVEPATAQVFNVLYDSGSNIGDHNLPQDHFAQARYGNL